jgi:GTPase Era involved in 16S rRNA processing
MGQPGAGKSSLLSKIGGRRLKPAPSIGVETDATDWAGSNECVLLFSSESWRVADVPGYDTQGHPAAAFLAGFPFLSFDAFIFVVRGKLRAADESVYGRLAATGKPVLIVRGFADGMDNKEVVDAIQDIRCRLGVPNSVKVVPVSNRTAIGIDTVRRWLRAQAKAKLTDHGLE